MINDKMREALDALDNMALHCNSATGGARDRYQRDYRTIKAALTKQPESEPVFEIQHGPINDNDGHPKWASIESLGGWDEFNFAPGTKLYAGPPPAQQPESESAVHVHWVPMPKTADQAELMAKAGMRWLEENAPHRLTQASPQVPEGYEIIKHLSGNWYFRHADSRHASANYWSTREQATTRAWEHFYRQIRRAQEKALELCVAVENEDDLPPIKYALRAGRLVNEVKELLAAAPSIAVKENESE